jgi:hypothetical protein
LITGATFGGPQAAFVTKYGGDGALYDINGVTFSLNVDSGVDGKPHVVSMLVYRSEVSTWTMAQAQTICRPFLPPDVIFQRQTTSSNGGLKYVYTSLQLAHTFAQSSPWHDPTGGVGLTYELHDGGVYQCELDESP